MNKKTVLGLCVAVTLAFCLVGCSKDPRDIKMSQLTMEQEEKVLKSLTREETELVASYQMRMAFSQMGQVFNDMSNALQGKTQEQKTKNPMGDLTINEIIKQQRAYEKENPSNGVIPNLFGNQPK